MKGILFEWFECLRLLLRCKRSNLIYLRWIRSYLGDLNVLRPLLSIRRSNLRCKRSNILEIKRPIWEHMGMFPLYWSTNIYFECKRLSFSLDLINCKPRNTCLNILRVDPSIQWHYLKVRPLESWQFNEGNFNL